jgi:rare lipoprotein A
VQAGAFAEADNAQRLLARLQAAGITSAFVLSPIAGHSHLFRVRLGPVTSVADYDQLAARLQALGIPDARLAND